MVESKNRIESILNMKFVGCVIALVGLGLFLRGFADLGYYVFDFNLGYSDPLVETVLFVVADLVCMAAAVGLWVVSAKLLRAKCC